MVVVPPEVHVHEHLYDVHAHSLPKYQLYAVCMHDSVKVMESDTIKLLDKS